MRKVSSKKMILHQSKKMENKKTENITRSQLKGKSKQEIIHILGEKNAEYSEEDLWIYVERKKIMKKVLYVYFENEKVSFTVERYYYWYERIKKTEL